MQRKTIVGAVLATAAFGFAAPAFAQSHEREREHDRRPDESRDGPQRRPDRGRGEWERDMHGPAGYGARGPEWHRGGRIPPAYRDRAYVVNDWRLHRLAPPPRGYEWIQVGPDYVLISVRTGIIAQIIVG